MEYEQSSSLRALRRAGLFSLHAGWQLLRVPLLTLLVMLEPIITFMVLGIALMGVLISLFYRYIVALPDFPFVLMMSLSVGLAMCMIPYYLLIRWLSR